jgi:hypothetical protein
MQVGLKQFNLRRQQECYHGTFGQVQQVIF